VVALEEEEEEDEEEEEENSSGSQLLIHEVPGSRGALRNTTQS
jgi:hypothetical protein